MDFLNFTHGVYAVINVKNKSKAFPYIVLTFAQLMFPLFV